MIGEKMPAHTKAVLRAIQNINDRGKHADLYALADETRLTWDEIKTSLRILINTRRCVEIYDLPDYEPRDEDEMFSLGKFRLKEQKDA
jgi:hypothetical protein